MKKIILLLIIIFALNANSIAQWEYQYFSFRVGLNHNMFSPTPSSTASPNFPDNDNEYYKLLTIPEVGGDMPLNVATGSDKLFYYGVGIAADFLFHFDLKNNKLGFATGVQYSSHGIGTNSLTENKKYELIEKYRVTSVGVPLMIKFGGNIYKKMSYFFVGGQVNYNMNLKEKQEVNFSEDYFVESGTIEKLKPINILFFAGYNFSIFNFEVGMMPDTFLDVNYSEAVEGGAATPLDNQSENIFYFKTSIHIPISEWTLSKSWQLEKFRRKFKRF